MFTQESFGYWLRLKRKSLDLTREGLAERVGCSAATIRKLEAEERRPSEQIVNRLAEIFDIPQNEREKFLRFARGELSFAPMKENKTLPWITVRKQFQSNMPTPVNSLVSRGKEIAELHNLLLNKDTRLITLIGPPGVGKTRLSMEIGRAILPDFPEGVFFIGLAPLNDASIITSTIIQILGYADRRDHSTFEMLKDGIDNKHMLLVLDNCEHVIDTIATLASGLLSACSHLKILATSRESLRVPGEQLYPLQPLDIPKETSTVDLGTAAHFPALTLFAERARAVRPDFRLDSQNIHAVAAICSRLDGLPLAIELIASRIRLISPQALLDRMTGQFVLSANGMRAVSARQKTLKNAIQWSYDFLPAEEQKLFAYLSVFSRGFTFETAEAIFSGMGFERAISDIITALSDKSLLTRNANTQGEVRFDMLFPIQQFAMDKLRQTEEETKIHETHLAHYVRLAEIGDAEMRGPHIVKWLNYFQEEHDNIRAALEWGVSTGRTQSALRLLCALGWYWEARAYYREAFNWLERINDLPDILEHPILYARLLNHVGRYHWSQENPNEAQVLLEKSMEVSLNAGTAAEFCLAETYNWLGLVIAFEGNDNAKARGFFESSLAINQRKGDQRGEALSIFHLGILENQSHQYAKALALLEQSLFLFEQLGDLFFIARTSLFLGYLFLNQSDFDKARFYFEQHLDLDTKIQFWDGIAEGWRDLGVLYQQMGEREKAERYFEQCRTVCREHGLTKTIPRIKQSHK